MKKFTLFELLMVIAIISILISLLLPSLRRSRHLALQAVCMSNQSQSFRGSVSYVKNNDGKLMPVNMRLDEPYYTNKPHNNYYLRYQNGAPASNLGVLYHEGYLSSARNFYCPGYDDSKQEVSLSSYEYYADAFGSFPTAGDMAILPFSSSYRMRCSYYFNPEGSSSKKTKYIQYENNGIFIMDLIRKKTLSHGPLGKKWVVILADGSGRVATSLKTYSKVMSSEVDNGWSSYHSALELLQETIQ